MSATFKNARKKLSQTELRRFMHEHKVKNQNQQATAKINSPLAKYNEAGQLTCILCKSIVRSETVWNVHINAKQHKQNVEQAKALKEKTNNFTSAVKRPASPPQQSSKKVKGILKNASKPSQDIPTSKTITVVVEDKKNTKTKSKNNDATNKSTETKEALPKDFFDTAGPSTTNAKTKKKKNDEQMDIDEPIEPETIPEGFFDDPKLDAKARNIEFKDPREEEWERFQKAIKDADFESAAIIAEDQDEATTERQIDEVEEQMKNWSRVVELDRKKVEIIQQVADVHMDVKEEDASSESDDDMDEFLDWRSKRAYK